MERALRRVRFCCAMQPGGRKIVRLRQRAESLTVSSRRGELAPAGILAEAVLRMPAPRSCANASPLPESVPCNAAVPFLCCAWKRTEPRARRRLWELNPECDRTHEA